MRKYVIVIYPRKFDTADIKWSTVIFVSPAKQKRDICTAFPASSLSSSSSAAA